MPTAPAGRDGREFAAALLPGWGLAPGADVGQIAAG
jgi:hypothetical protein